MLLHFGILMSLLGDSGGAGCYGNVLEFQKILQSLVSTDETLLGRDMKEELFRPQLGTSLCALTLIP